MFRYISRRLIQSIPLLFGVSVILGLERKYVNTTASMITHALFNAIQVLALASVS